MDALKEIVATATGDVSTISSALEHIRRGQFERAIVLLERGLDRSVFCLDCIRQEPDLEDQDKELIMTALKFARTHRRRYPRQPEADIEGTPLAEMQEMAKKILEGIGDWRTGHKGHKRGGGWAIRQQFLKNRRLSQDGVFKKWYSQLIHHYFLLKLYRSEREKSFAEPPEFSLLWSDSGNSVAVLLSGEPWAFVCEEENHGHSKGILKPEHYNVWDQELFEKIFPK